MNKRTFSKYFLLLILVTLTVYVLYLVKTYAIGIIFSFIFAFLFSKTYDRLMKHVKKDWIAAGLVILLISSFFMVPAIYVTYAFVNQAQDYITSLDINTTGDNVYDLTLFLEKRFRVRISNSDAGSIISLFSDKVIPSLETFFPSVLQAFSRLGVQLFISAFLLFYLLINKKFVLEKFMCYVPLTHKHAKSLLEATARNTRALVVGQGMIAIIQGLAGAIGYVIFDIDGAFLWGVVMGIMSFIPFLGTALVWVPSGILLLAQHDYVSGFGILIWGALIVGNVDNLVRPKLVSKLGDIHPVIVLLGIFIGISAFNIPGIIIGPLLLTTLLHLYKLFRMEYVKG